MENQERLTREEVFAGLHGDSFGLGTFRDNKHPKLFVCEVALLRGANIKVIHDMWSQDRIWVIPGSDEDIKTTYEAKEDFKEQLGFDSWPQLEAAMRHRPDDTMEPITEKSYNEEEIIRGDS